MNYVESNLESRKYDLNMLMEEECKNNLKINDREIIENFRNFDDLEIYFLNRLYLIYLESKFKNEKFSRIYLTQLDIVTKIIFQK